MAGQEPTAAQRAETILAALKRTMDRYRWCWDCGSTESQCKGRARSVGAPQKCCPDCRHRGWPEELDADADLVASMQRVVQMLVWKAGGSVTFTERDLVAVQLADLPAAEIGMVDDPAANPERAAWVRLRGFPQAGLPEGDVDAEIRRMRGN